MSQNQKKHTDSSMPQVIGLLLILLALIALSTVGTLVAVGVIDLSEEANPVGSITQAEGICNQQVRGDYGAQLNAMTVDDRSSRYDTKRGIYKMFYQIDVYRGGGQQAGTDVFYVNCFVAVENGKISRIEYLEQKDFKPKAIRRTHGNAFGF